MKKFILLSLVIFFTANVFAQRATWIWHPGDYEIWLSNKMQNRRTERGTFYPPFWKMDAHYVLVDFHKVFDVSQREDVKIFTEGSYNIKLDGKAFEGSPTTISVPAGKHKINIKVWCQDNVPAIFVQGKTIVSDSSWLVTPEDKEWIDESGKASDQSGTAWANAGSWNFDKPDVYPSGFRLPQKLQRPAQVTKNGRGMLVDFGKETFGSVQLHGLDGKGIVSVYYGESKEEALSTTHCETLDRINLTEIPAGKMVTQRLPTKAFRYVNVQPDENSSVDSITMRYEYADLPERGNFKCSDETINRIYDVAKYTFELNTREFFIDGIKRDRWIWSGDAYQSYLMNYYLYFDAPTVTRTLFALRGKDPVTAHINTIMDYTFYWFLGIYDYYLYTGDKQFVQQCYPRMQSLMDWCLARRNKDGLLQGLAGDWIFIDWADGLSKKGEVSFEQLLFVRSLETMALCAEILDDSKNTATYKKLAADLKSKFFSLYWDASKQAIVHSRIDGKPTENVTRYANMFAIFFNYLTEAQKQGVKKNVLLNDKVPKITTPYMRFYELEALCAMKEQDYVLKEMKEYWGGMLKLGATSFWEKYDPAESGAAHYAMYGRPFGKSLCHAWGASPLYLLGKYYLGVQPTAPGYKTYIVEPVLGGLEWMEGSVPTPKGDIRLRCSKQEIRITASEGTGTLRFTSKKKPYCEQGATIAKPDNTYEIEIKPGKEYVVRYNL
jgi:alpha-L-rhamnosidase